MARKTYTQCNMTYGGCGKLTEQPADACHNCGKQFESSKAPDYYIQSFRTGWYEHIDLDPIYIKGRKQLAQECDRRGLSSHYVH